MTCKIYHFNAFKKLRDFVGETDFVQSIMRCSKWEAKGGKSGASFFKSHDKRFVIKHIGVKEVKTIVDKGSLYVDYVISNQKSDKTSCLAKIYGVFQIQFKHNEAKSHYLVMEVGCPL